MKTYTSLNNRLSTQHLTLAELTVNIPPGRLLMRPAPGKWNIHDNVAHLAKYQGSFMERIYKILNEDRPYFQRYKAEDDPEFERFRKLADAELIKCLHEQRIKLAELILNLSETALGRTGIHQKYGALTIIQWTEFFLLHEAHHLFTIFQLANDVDLN